MEDLPVCIVFEDSLIFLAGGHFSTHFGPILRSFCVVLIYALLATPFKLYLHVEIWRRRSNLSSEKAGMRAVSLNRITVICPPSSLLPGSHYCQLRGRRQRSTSDCPQKTTGTVHSSAAVAHQNIFDFLPCSFHVRTFLLTFPRPPLCLYYQHERWRNSRAGLPFTS